ncbi:ketoacyl-synt-domain-containing protein [Ceraceosorus guamensis]|uniref:Ketoacyl-synt-domain-containing protein n=1 Tax=Ceraceosorus guamensis TaxID=1522189 RepID=A0A316VSA3_9BASI|nr:ketoacyl-synt-domain-containing protein [Ceraceosorus guamensis]PWN40240.1 ketoacyl-synt-domain-containing protein [Ceraceosorus guamensis]
MAVSPGLAGSKHQVPSMPSSCDAAMACKDPVVIVSTGYRLPGGIDNDEDLWKALLAPRATANKLLTTPPANRWPAPDAVAPHHSNARTLVDLMQSSLLQESTPRGGWIVDGVHSFDPTAFGIPVREAPKVRPSARLLLECARDAIYRAGLATSSFRASSTGVYVGTKPEDNWNDLLNASNAPITEVNDRFIAGATSFGTASARLSSWLGCEGPCMTIDTACSSSTVALHLATQSLLTGESEQCLVGGVTVHAHPSSFHALSASRMRSTSNQNVGCEVFADSACGYVPSEGAVVMLLMRESAALRRNLPIAARLMGTATKHLGHSSAGFLAPNAQAEADVMRLALRAANMDAEDVDVLELHGTGTQVGDVTEASAIQQVFDSDSASSDSDSRQASTRITVTSLKTALGHTEEVSGLVGIIKMLICLQRNLIPPFLLYGDPNHKIDWLRAAFKLNSTAAILRPSAATRSTTTTTAMINSFGAFGVVSSSVIQSAAQHLSKRASFLPTLCLSVSARTATQLASFISHYADAVERCTAPHDLASLARRTAGLISSEDPFRFSIPVAGDRGQLISTLRSTAAQATHSGFEKTIARTVVFVFAGQGRAIATEACQLLWSSNEAIFCRALRDSSSVLGFNVIEHLSDNRPSFHQPTVIALQLALARLLESWNILPAVVLGHSLGSICAAQMAGFLSIDEALRLAQKRGQLLEALVDAPGSMLAAKLDRKAASDLLEELDLPGVVIAVENTARSMVFSGPAESVLDLQAALTRRGFKTRIVNDRFAFHSPQMEPISEPLEAFVDELLCESPENFKLATFPSLISDHTGGQIPKGTRLGGGYWARHACEAVHFGAALDTVALQADGATPFYVEVNAFAAAFGGFLSDSTAVVDKTGNIALSNLLAQAFGAGVDVDWNAVHASSPAPRSDGLAHPIPLRRQRYWPSFEVTSPTSLPQGSAVVARHAISSPSLKSIPTLLVPHYASQTIPYEAEAGTVIFETPMGTFGAAVLRGHRLCGLIVFPIVFMMEYVLKCCSRHERLSSASTLSNLKFLRPVAVSDAELESVSLRLEVEAHSTFRLFARLPSQTTASLVVMTGEIGGQFGVAPAQAHAKQSDIAPALRAPIDETFYAALREGSPFDLSGHFQRIALRQRRGGDLNVTFGASLCEPSSWMFDPGAMDACMHACASTQQRHLKTLLLPSALERFSLILPGADWGDTRATVRLVDERPVDWFVHNGEQTIAAAQGLHCIDVPLRVITASISDKDKRRNASFSPPAVSHSQVDSLPERSLPPFDHFVAQRTWKPVRSRALTSARTTHSSFTILADDVELAKELLNLSGADGRVITSRQDVYENLRSHHSVELISSAADDVAMSKALSRNAGSSSGKQALICAWPLSVIDASPELAMDHVDLISARLLSLMKALVNQTSAWSAVVITRDALHGHVTSPSGVISSTLHGMVSGFANELRGRTTCVALDTCALLRPAQIASATEEILALSAQSLPPGPFRYEIVDGVVRRLAPSLDKYQPAQIQHRLPSEGTWVITGASGTIMTVILPWLVKSQRIQQVAIFGRRKQDPNYLADVRKRLPADVQVHYETVDLHSSFSVSNAMKRVPGTVKGIVHAAGVTRPALVRVQSREAYDEVFAPKVKGAWNLHQHAPSTLEHFVLFSTFATVNVFPAMTNYLAANFFLNSLASFRRTQGLPAMAIGFGSWPGSPMLDGLSPALNAECPPLVDTKAYREIEKLMLMESPPAMLYLATLAHDMVDDPHSKYRLDPQWRHLLDSLASQRSASSPRLPAAASTIVDDFTGALAELPASLVQSGTVAVQMQEPAIPSPPAPPAANGLSTSASPSPRLLEEESDLEAPARIAPGADPRHVARDIKELVLHIFGFHDDHAREEFRDDQRLETYGWDSLYHLELTSQVKEKLGIELPESLDTGMATLQEICAVAADALIAVNHKP